MEPMELEEGSQGTESPTWSTSDSSTVQSDANYDSDYQKFLDDNYDRLIALCKHLWPSAIESTIRVYSDFEDDWQGFYVFDLCFDSQGIECGGSRQVDYHCLNIHVPREQKSIQRTVAILQYLENHKHLKAPRVVKWDATKDNPLGMGYIIISRVTGEFLALNTEEITMCNITHDQKLAVARQLAALYRQMETITNPIAGIIEACQNIPTHGGTGTEDHIFVQPFGTECRCKPNDTIKSEEDNIQDVGKLPNDRLHRDPPNVPVGEIMLVIYQRHMYHSRNCHKEDHQHSFELCEQLKEMMQKIVDQNGLGSDTICLRLPGLTVRNIMYERDADGNPLFTGVIGWDDAMFVPASRPASRRGGYGARESILRTPNNLLTAITPENEEIKRAFTEAVGENWMAEAEDERLALARALLDFSREVAYPNPTNPPVAMKEAWKALAEGVPDTTDPGPSGKLPKSNETGEEDQEQGQPLWWCLHDPMDEDE
ncbi:hypothetical protein PG997_011395 [Apiospora hydei]|uniref:Uncharacterized protein n=1 Tax=Apiospora hydei TaxID=1337664 RepID=A0ABR1VIX8_9PEZI